MRWPAVFAVLAALAACGDSAASGPFDGLPLDGDFTVGVDAPVHVARNAWDPLVRQDALAPFFVLPGDGAGDWIADASLSPRYIPHAVDPTQGYLITANADPVGATSRWVFH
jgi:hypothetical protein